MDVFALRAAGAVLLGCGIVALLATCFGLYGIDHNAFYTCDAEPRPPGARPYEAGYAGHGTTVFPVAGVECQWNATNGGVFSTVIPDAGTTATMWSAIVLCLTGPTLLTVATRRANRVVPL
jgi:hypothetical protein